MRKSLLLVLMLAAAGELQFMFDAGAKHSVERITLTRARVSSQ
jgi:hypothetical protein